MAFPFIWKVVKRITSSIISPSKNQKTETFFQRLWRWFIAPSSQIEGKDNRRQAALLSTFILGLVLTSLLVEGIYTFPAAQTNYPPYGEIIRTLGLLILIYSVSRTKYVQLAAILTVLACSYALFATCLHHPDSVLGGLFDYLMIPLWLGSFYLSANKLTLLISAELAGLLIFPFFARGITLDDVLVGPFSFVFVTSVLLIIMTRHRNQLEQDRRAELAEKEQRSRHEAARAEALLRVADRLSFELDLDTLLKTINSEVTRALNTTISLVALYDPKSNVFYPTSAVGIIPDRIKDMVPFPRFLYDETVKAFGITFGLTDLQVYPRLPNLDIFQRLHLRSMAFATMEYQDELIGSLTAITSGEIRTFTEDELLLLQGLADQAALAITKTRLFEDARRRLEHLQALRAVDTVILSNHDLQQTLDLLLAHVTNQLKVDAAVVLLVDETDQTLVYGASRGFFSPLLRTTRLRIGDGMAGRAAQQRKIVYVHDLSTDPGTLANSPTLATEGFAGYIAAPLTSHEKVRGVLEIFDRSSLDPDPEWLVILDALAEQAAIAIESTRLFEDLRRTNDELSKAYDSTIEGWSLALDLRDKETEGHAQRVTDLTLELARAFGFIDAELVHVRRGALLHDIGKMGVPDRILLKEAPLTDEEWVLMRRHPEFAYEMIRSVEYLKASLDIPYCHHEKWDGTGYPRGLKGEQIPLTARLFAVVDVWDALTSDRPYRPAWTPEKTLAHIQEQAGSHFDPHVTEIFVKMIKENRIAKKRSLRNIDTNPFAKHAKGLVPP